MAALRETGFQLDEVEAVRTVVPDLVVAEFESLRTEILQRTEFQHRVINLTLGAALALLTLCLHQGVSKTILWVFPMVALLMAIMWSFDNMRITQIGHYIRTRVEAPYRHGRGVASVTDPESAPSAFYYTGWEHYLCSPDSDPLIRERWFSSVSGATGVFLLCQLGVIAIGLAWPSPHHLSNVDLALIGLDIPIIWFTLRLTVRSHQMNVLETTDSEEEQKWFAERRDIDRRVVRIGTVVVAVAALLFVASYGQSRRMDIPTKKSLSKTQLPPPRSPGIAIRP